MERKTIALAESLQPTRYDRDAEELERRVSYAGWDLEHDSLGADPDHAAEIAALPADLIR